MNDGESHRASRRPLVAGVFIFSLILYSLTCAPGVVWQDSATFMVRIARFDLHSRLGLALAHPLYIVLCKSFTFLLPLGSLAFRVNLFSSLCAAAALAVLVDLLLCIMRSRAAAILPIILLAVSHTFWRHAVIAEVMSLYALGLAIELRLIERLISTRRTRWLILALFVNGLNTSNHLLATLHLPAYLCLMAWLGRERALSWRTLFRSGGAYVLGASPYLGLVLAEGIGGRPWFEVARSALFGEGFDKDVLNVSGSPLHLAARTAQYFALNFPTPLVLIAPLGLAALGRDSRVRGLMAFALAVFVVNLIFAARYPVADQYVFFMGCYVLTALFVAAGLDRLRSLRGGPLMLGIFFALFPVAVYEFGPDLLKRRGISAPFRQDIAYRDAYAYFLRPRMNGEYSAERFAREALEAVPKDGLLIADFSVNNVLVYVRDVMGVRPDVALTLPADILPAQPRHEIAAVLIEQFASRGAAYSATKSESYLPQWLRDEYDLQPRGIVFQLVRRKK